MIYIYDKREKERKRETGGAQGGKRENKLPRSRAFRLRADKYFPNHTTRAGKRSRARFDRATFIAALGNLFDKKKKKRGKKPGTAGAPMRSVYARVG